MTLYFYKNKLCISYIYSVNLNKSRDFYTYSKNHPQLWMILLHFFKIYLLESENIFNLPFPSRF